MPMTKYINKYNKYSKKRNVSRKKICKPNKNKISNKTHKNKTNKKYKYIKRGAGPDEDRLKAQQKIGQFMLQNRDKIRSKYLQTICEDSGACISFGTEVNKINELFGNFVNFNYAISPVKSIGGVSANGFVKQIKYMRNDYECYAVLKSSNQQESDNLMYEYEVGVNFVNKQNKIFPCFLETYGLFLYKDDESWLYSMETTDINIEELKDSIIEQKEIDYTIGCPKSKHLSILIQHIKNAKTFDKYIDEILVEPIYGERLKLFNCDLPYILYQIYMPLATLAEQFTHYDLHNGNVLLYEPVKDSYITYYYHLTTGKIIEFNSKYIVKIIDYGRCYYNNGTQSSLDTYKKICNTAECGKIRKTECGGDFGFKVLSPEDRPGSFYFISSQNKNISIDMRLIYNIVQMLKLSNYDTYKKYSIMFEHLNQSFINILKKIVYNKPSFLDDLSFGTREILESGLSKNKIHNVKDLCEELGEYIIQHAKSDLMYYHDLPKIGDFHIYQDGRPMEFIKKLF